MCEVPCRSVIARRRCPDLIILPGRFDRYEEYSRRFHDIVRDLTPDFEPLGLDEVFANLRSLRRLDVRPLDAAGASLRRRIMRRTRSALRRRSRSQQALREAGLQRVQASVVDGGSSTAPASCGSVRRSRSKWLAELPVRALWGVGPATATKLQKLGLRWVRDLAQVDEATLGRARRRRDGGDPRRLRARRGRARGDGRSGRSSRWDTTRPSPRPWWARRRRRGGAESRPPSSRGHCVARVGSRARSRWSCDSTTSRA